LLEVFEKEFSFLEHLLVEMKIHSEFALLERYALFNEILLTLKLLKFFEKILKEIGELNNLLLLDVREV